MKLADKEQRTDEFQWIGDGVKSTKKRKAEIQYSCFKHGKIVVSVGDDVMISNDDAQDPECDEECYIARVNKLYDRGDETDPERYRAVVQWYLRPVDLQDKKFKNPPACHKWEVILDCRKRVCDTDVDAESIFQKCEVHALDPEESIPKPVASGGRLQLYVRWKLFGLKFLGIKNSEEIVLGKRKSVARRSLFDFSAVNYSKRANSLDVSDISFLNQSRDAVKAAGKRLRSIDIISCNAHSRLPTEVADHSAKADSPCVSPIKSFYSKKSVTTPSKYSSTPQKDTQPTPTNDKPNTADGNNVKRSVRIKLKRLSSSVKNDYVSKLRNNTNVASYEVSIVEGTPAKKRKETAPNKGRNKHTRQVNGGGLNRDENNVKSNLERKSGRVGNSKYNERNARSLMQSDPKAKAKVPRRKLLQSDDSSDDDQKARSLDSKLFKCKVRTTKLAASNLTPVKSMNLNDHSDSDSDFSEELLSSEDEWKKNESKSSDDDDDVDDDDDEDNEEDIVHQAAKTRRKGSTTTSLRRNSTRRTARLQKSSDDEDSDDDSLHQAKKSRRNNAKTTRTRAKRNTMSQEVGSPKDKLKRNSNPLPGICLRVGTQKTPGSAMEEARNRLHVSAVPDSLPCRENEYEEILSYVEDKLSSKSSGCMYISGVPGTGKTATVYEVMRSVMKKQRRGKLPAFQFIEINGMKLSEPRQAYVLIVKKLLGKKMAAEAAVNFLEKRFSHAAPRREPLVMLVDELDLLWTNRQDVLYNLFEWPSRAGSKLIVLAIANAMNLPERIMMNRVVSRIGMNRMCFQPYTHQQLQEIILARLKGLQAFDPDAVKLISRKVAALSGDARRALDICRRAAEIGECNKGSNRNCLVNVKHVSQALQEMFSSAKVMTLKNASLLEQFFMKAIVDEFHHKGLEETTFNRVYPHFKSLCRLEEIPVPTISTTFSICSRLGTSKLLLTEDGRNGIIQRMRLNMSSEDVNFALKDRLIED